MLWHSFGDGVVVYVNASCETHLLPPEFAELLHDPSRVVIDDPADHVRAPLGEDPEHPALLVPRPVIDELVQLQILRVIP